MSITTILPAPPRRPIWPRVANWFRNLPAQPFALAFRVVRRSMQRDDGLYQAWHAAISVWLQDNTSLHRDEADAAATGLIKHIFNADKIPR